MVGVLMKVLKKDYVEEAEVVAEDCRSYSVSVRCCPYMAAEASVLQEKKQAYKKIMDTFQ